LGGQYRVVLLDEAHSMSKEAFNALLKVLEEPPPNTVFILLTTEPNKILETVLSRCMPFEFRRMTNADIVTRLTYICQQEDLHVDEDVLEAIAAKVQGGMRDAVMILDQVTRTGATNILQFRELFGISDVSVDLIQAAADGNAALGYKIIEDYFFRVGDAAGMVNDLTGLIRDLLVIKAGGSPRVHTELDEAIRRDLAARLPQDKLIATVRVLWDIKARTRHVDNDQRAAMELAYALIVDALSGAPAASTTATAAPRRLSLQEMGQLSARGA
jgi:DNA polymerase-3 subunit gamma/tau